MHRKLRPFVAVAFAAALAALTGSAVSATYPGDTNGRIAFFIVGPDGNRDIFSIHPNGRGLRPLTSDPSFDACPAYSRDGDQIVFCSNRSGTFEIWAMNQNGHNQHQVTNLGGFALFPDFSPSGRRIAFGGQEGADPDHEVFVVHADGSGLLALTNGSGNNDFPVWSPDGSRIAFISDRTGVQQVWVMKADGSHQKQLTTSLATHGQVPDWSPDGARIAYAEGDDNERIFVMNADGSNPVALTSGAADDFGPVWSPDGEHIAFLRFAANGDHPIVVMNADGSDQHVLDNSGPHGVPAWQPREDRDREQDK